MSGLIVPKYMTDVSELYLTSPAVFEVLSSCMTIQPDLDPDAGYGVFQIPTLFLNLNLDLHDAEKLCERLAYSPYKTYVFIRSVYMGGVSREEVKQFIAGEVTFDLNSLHKDLLNFIPRFKKRGLKKLLS